MNIEQPNAPQKQILNPEKIESKKQKTGLLKWLPLFVMSLALTIIILDTTILNVTLRTIVVDLKTTLQSIQWVITAYSLMLAAFTITGGRLGDLFGRKKMFVLGAIIFAVGSFMTSISHSVSFMIAGEAIIEGIGACLMMPATLSLLRSNYKGRDMQTAFGIWGGIIAGAAALGPVIGGWFTTHYTWRWAFRVNVFVAILLVITSVFIEEYRDKEEKPSIDIIGIILSALGMLAVVFGFIQASNYGWLHMQAPLIIFGRTINLGKLSATPVFIAIGAAILALFLRWEAHVEKIGRTPLVSPQLFKNKTFMAGTSVSAILALGQAGLSFAIPVYLQAVLNLNPIQTGLAMVPMTAVILFAAPFSAWVSKFITPKRIIQFGIILDTIGFIVIRQEGLRFGANQWALAPGFILFGLGMGLMMAQTSNLTLSAVSVEQAGEASGVTSTIRSLGQTLGSAIMGAILLSTLSANIVTGIQNSNVIPQSAKPTITKTISAQASNLEFSVSANAQNKIPTAINNELTTITNQATINGNKAAIGYGIIFILLALMISTQLPNAYEIEAESLAHHSKTE